MPAGVDNFARVGRVNSATRRNGHNAISAHRDIPVEPRVAATVDHFPVLNQ
jgi:hypothetical protein